MFKRRRKSTPPQDFSNYLYLTSHAVETVEALRQVRDALVAGGQDARIRDYLRRRGVEDAEWVERAQNELAEWNRLAQGG